MPNTLRYRHALYIGALALDGVELTGKGYRVSDQGLAIFGRLLELERDGHTVKAAATVVEDELEIRASQGQDSAAERRATVEVLDDELVSVLKSQVEHHQKEIDFLRDQLVVSRNQLQAMLLASA